ncbi:hypothetical protein WMY93_019956 [Mugilogobius chulae]|uniref:Uncharacterized protein n=1 Tax=Mugilogobius chulae TaxID=88201 RepID=A0AAW0NIM8_9GOBI
MDVNQKGEMLVPGISREPGQKLSRSLFVFDEETSAECLESKGLGNSIYSDGGNQFDGLLHHMTSTLLIETLTHQSDVTHIIVGYSQRRNGLKITATFSQQNLTDLLH